MVGASIFVEVNKILVQAVEDFGLNLRSSKDEGEDDVDFAMYALRLAMLTYLVGTGHNSCGRNLETIIGMLSKWFDDTGLLR
jgi:hypothetical protein